MNSYYLLLADLDFSKTSVQKAIQERQRDLAFGGGEMLLNLIATDPFLQTLSILQRLAPDNGSEGVWFASEGSAVLLAETKAVASNINRRWFICIGLRQSCFYMAKSNTVHRDVISAPLFRECFSEPDHCSFTRAVGNLGRATFCARDRRNVDNLSAFRHSQLLYFGFCLGTKPIGKRS